MVDVEVEQTLMKLEEETEKVAILQAVEVAWKEEEVLRAVGGAEEAYQPVELVEEAVEEVRCRTNQDKQTGMEEVAAQEEEEEVAEGHCRRRIRCHTQENRPTLAVPSAVLEEPKDYHH